MRAKAPLTFAQFWQRVVRIPAPDGRLIVPSPHLAQREVIEALDARDAEGLRQFWTVFLWWSRKTSKDFMLGAYGAYHLTSDPFEHDERLVVVAAWDQEQTLPTLRTTQALVERHPFLRRRVKMSRHELLYVEERTDPRTGGKYRLDHRMIGVARDTKGTHGLRITLKLKNEAWVDTDYSFEEALTLSPAARSPLTIYASYHPLQASMRPGIPIFDLIQRSQAGDERMFTSYVGGEGERAPWVIVPWITLAWIEEQRTVLKHAPNRFRRMVLNIPAGADQGLITPEELRDAIDPQAPAALPPGGRITIGVDLGLANDWTAIVVVRREPVTGSIRVLETVTFRGTRERPVDLMAVETALLRLHQRWQPAGIAIDAWNAALLVQRLRQRNVGITVTPTEATLLDRMITRVKGLFSRRAIQIPAGEAALLEQLESVQTVDSRIGKRDTLKFAPSGKGPAAGQHDDLVVALGLAIEQSERSTPRVLAEWYDPTYL